MLQKNSHTLFDEFFKHFMLSSFRFKFIAVKKNSKFQNEVKYTILFLRNFLLQIVDFQRKYLRIKSFWILQKLTIYKK